MDRIGMPDVMRSRKGFALPEIRATALGCEMDLFPTQTKGVLGAYFGAEALFHSHERWA